MPALVRLKRNSSSWLVLVHCLFLFLTTHSANAVDPNRRISQYGHTAWRMQDGIFNSIPNVIAQSADGYIWIGTQAGLVRYDGSRFVPGTTSTGQPLPDIRITSLRKARDGSLWIGTPYGLNRLKDGELISYSNTIGISTIIEDHEGTIWVTRYRITDGKGPLCRAIDQGLQCYGKEEGIPVNYGVGLAEDSLGNLWIGSFALVRWRPGSTETFFEEELKHLKGNPGVLDIAAGPTGSIWIALEGKGPHLGVRHYADGKWSTYTVPGFDGSRVSAQSLFMDRDGALWIGTDSEGLYRIYNGKADHFRAVNGLSGDSVISFFQDREGNIWVATNGGVDLFRNTPMINFSAQEGVAAANIRSVLASLDGSLWIGGKDSLDNLRGGEFSSVKTGQGLPGEAVSGMFEDHAGRLWLGVDDKLMVYERGKFSELQNSNGQPLALGGHVIAITEDLDQNIWAMANTAPRHLYRIKDQKIRDEVSVRDIQYASWLASDNEGGVWLGSYSDNKIAHYSGGQLQVLTLPQREKNLLVNTLIPESARSVWVASNSGLLKWKDGQVKTLGIENGLPCSMIYSAIKDNRGALWMYTNCGLVSISQSELEKWWDHPEDHVSMTTFTAPEGVRPGSTAAQPRATKTVDGRLWFSNGLSVQVIDPENLFKNDTPPLVVIEGLVADRKNYSAIEKLRLPARTTGLEIDYTALSFSVPQKVLFRYKLDGYDVDWQEPGTRRQAIYSDLGPGTYTFHVIAANNDGVWNETGATLVFTIPPAWFQTIWFRLLCIVAAVLILFGLYRLRVRQIARVISLRFDERLAERTRLARDLHDTLLQTIHGCTMVANDALEKPADSDYMRRAMERLSTWLNQATEEGRAALNSLRTSTTERNDLAEGFRRATQDGLVPSSMTVDVAVVGAPKEMHPIVRDEVFRIGYEAIRNSIVHSNASSLRIELRYEHDLLVSVKDNGVGIDPVIVTEGKTHHFGLQGMRERAARIGGKLTLVTSPATGTEVIIIVPGSIVFRKYSATDQT
ncbi:MAG TPA: two-component regulator propeller domain-containing protein [Pyrinomonadaceae bacterium]|nr:two-component regulator propeller domain-containing protein [Pyrinomonadaceae bacterium]